MTQPHKEGCFNTTFFKDLPRKIYCMDDLGRKLQVLWAKKLGCGFYEISCQDPDSMFYSGYLAVLTKTAGFLVIEGCYYKGFPWRTTEIRDRLLEVMSDEQDEGRTE